MKIHFKDIFWNYYIKESRVLHSLMFAAVGTILLTKYFRQELIKAQHSHKSSKASVSELVEWRGRHIAQQQVGELKAD